MVKELDDAPQLSEDEALWFEIFGEMHRDRPVGFGGGLPLPSAVIDYWADKIGLSGITRDDFEHAVKALDEAWLASVHKKEGDGGV